MASIANCQLASNFCVHAFPDFSATMAATKSDKHPKAGKKMTGKASVAGDVSWRLRCLYLFREPLGVRRERSTSVFTSIRY